MGPEIAKTQEEWRRMEQQLASLTSVTFDTDLYGGNDRDAYVTSIPVNEDDENIDTMDNEVAGDFGEHCSTTMQRVAKTVDAYLGRARSPPSEKDQRDEREKRDLGRREFSGEKRVLGEEED